VILILFIRYKREVSMVKYAKPNRKLSFVRYNREFAITVIVITEFDCIMSIKEFQSKSTYFVCLKKNLPVTQQIGSCKQACSPLTHCGHDSSSIALQFAYKLQKLLLGK
jgi:hypothetical protein